LAPTGEDVAVSQSVVGRVGRWCARHAWWVIAAWVAAVAAGVVATGPLFDRLVDGGVPRDVESVAAFEAAILLDPGFSEYVLRPTHQAAIQDRLGPLQAEEVYIPEPYPFLGGTEEPDTYNKGNFWVFASLVGMSHGFE